MHLYVPFVSFQTSQKKWFYFYFFKFWHLSKCEQFFFFSVLLSLAHSSNRQNQLSAGWTGTAEEGKWVNSAVQPEEGRGLTQTTSSWTFVTWRREKALNKTRVFPGSTSGQSGGAGDLQTDSTRPGWDVQRCVATVQRGEANSTGVTILGHKCCNNISIIFYRYYVFSRVFIFIYQYFIFPYILIIINIILNF